MSLTFFERNKQRRPQWSRTRRNGHRVRPQVVVHTYEAPHTRSLLAAATYLLQRTDPGSYHALVGDDSAQDVLQLAPWSAETWHSVPSNNWSVGISMVAYAHQWKTIPRSSRDNLVKSAAYAAAAFNAYMERTYNESVPARLLTRAEAMKLRPGFVSHATMDPGRRTDPGRDFPWDDFFAEYRRLTSGGTTMSTPAEIAKHNTSHLLNYKNPASRKHSVYGYLIDASEKAFGNLVVHRGGKQISALQELADIKTQVIATQATVENLVGAVAALARDRGESFDETKLLDGIRNTIEATLAQGIAVDVSFSGLTAEGAEAPEEDA